MVFLTCPLLRANGPLQNFAAHLRGQIFPCPQQLPQKTGRTVFLEVSKFVRVEFPIEKDVRMPDLPDLSSLTTTSPPESRCQKPPLPRPPALQ